VLTCCAGCAGPVLGPVRQGPQADSPPVTPAAAAQYSDTAWQRLLLKHVAAGWPDAESAAAARSKPLPGLVDYGAILAGPEDLDAYLTVLAQTGPKSTPDQFPRREHRLAYYINAYNAAAIRAVLAQYPTDSVYAIESPSFEHWWRFRIDGADVTLHDLRQAAWREAAGDVKVLFALCEAAVGGAPLSGSPYRPEKLTAQLQAQLYTCLGLPQIVRISHGRRQLQLWWRIVSREGEFLSYYKRIYRSAPASLLNVLMELSEPRNRQWLNRAVGYRIVPMPFDRRLNRLVVRAGPAAAGPTTPSRR